MGAKQLFLNGKVSDIYLFIPNNPILFNGSLVRTKGTKSYLGRAVLFIVAPKFYLLHYINTPYCEQCTSKITTLVMSTTHSTIVGSLGSYPGIHCSGISWVELKWFLILSVGWITFKARQLYLCNTFQSKGKFTDSC